MSEGTQKTTEKWSRAFKPSALSENMRIETQQKGNPKHQITFVTKLVNRKPMGCMKTGSINTLRNQNKQTANLLDGLQLLPLQLLLIVKAS
uniref:Uncharacterized protein n=1 Tax=Rhizophora mucronata TaxID=61149 RepID=A0A2P2P4Y2_RHIMU